MYVRLEPGPGAYGAAATLRPAPPCPAVLPQGLGEKIARLDLTVDLGAQIGTRRWLRGAATCIGLCWLTLSLSPDATPLVGAAPRPLSGRALEAAEAQSIRPLALGGKSGARMAQTSLARPIANVPERATIDVTAMLGPGDAMGSALLRAGVSAADAARAHALLAGDMPRSGFPAGTTLSITLGQRPHPGAQRPLQTLDFRARFDLRLRVERSGGVLSAARLPIRVDSRPLRLSGRVGPSLYHALRAAGASFDIAQSYLRALAMHIDFETDLPPDARFDVILANQRAETGEVRTGALLYAGLANGQRTLQLLPWTVDGLPGWYDAASVGQRRTGMISPIAAARVSSGFGFRIHPILGYSRLHRGTDYAAGYGTPIRAVTDGVVTQAGWSGGYGQMVRLGHAGGLGSGYAHMSRIVVGPGQRVVQGQLIGYVGSTGLSTGPHLHFEVYRNGAAVSPASVSFESQALLSGQDLEAFRARLRTVLAMAPPSGQRPAATSAARAPAPQSAGGGVARVK